MAALEFRSTDLHDNGLRLQLTQGYSEPVSTRGTDTIVPGRAGRIVRNRKADARKLILAGYVTGATPAEWRAATDELAAIIDTRLDPGDVVLTGPYLGLGTGVTATILARVVNALSGPILAGMTYQRWDIELESVDPDWVIGGS